MAERTVNVTINYKVNTADVLRAQQAAQAAQRATDQLRNSASRYGPESAKSFKQSSDAAKATQREVASLDSQFNSLYNSVRLFLTAGIVKEVVDITLSMAKLSGTVEGVERAFNRLPNSTLLLESLRKATRGTVTDLELMQRTLMASNFRIPLEKLGVLLEFAAVKAQQTGQEVNHLVNYIISGIGYRSIKRLDDLGFTLNRVRDALGGVSLQAASMQQVMDAVTKLMQEDLEKTGGFAETSATKVGQLETKWHELRVALSQKFETSPMLEYFEKVLHSATTLIQSFPTKQFQDIFQWSSLLGINMFRRMSDVIAHWQLGIDDVLRQEEIVKNATEEAERVKARLDEKAEKENLTQKEKLDLLEKEIAYKQKVAEEYFYNIQAVDMTVDKWSEENIARRLNLKEIEETIRILKELRKAQEEAAPPDVEDDGPRAKPPKMTQVVDLRFRDPATGTISKAHNDKILQDFIGRGIKIMTDAAAIQPVEIPITPIILLTDLERSWEQHKSQVLDTGLTVVQEQINSLMMAEAEGYTERIELLREFYDEQVSLAGDNERRKRELRIKEEREITELEKRRADRDKKAAQAGIIAHTALSIIKVWSGEGTYIDKLIRSAIVAAEGASQYAVASRAKYYAKGVINLNGPGTETSDSIPAFLSKGESVITAKATRKSMGLLEAIQANKIDDRILKQIDFSGGRTLHASLNDQRIVDKLEAIRKSQGRLEEQAGILYRVFEDEHGNKRRIRSKSI